MMLNCVNLANLAFKGPKEEAVGEGVPGSVQEAEAARHRSPRLLQEQQLGPEVQDDQIHQTDAQSNCVKDPCHIRLTESSSSSAYQEDAFLMFLM